MKTEQTITPYESPYKRMRELLIKNGIENPLVRMAISDLLYELMLEQWDDGFKKADRIHREMLEQYNK